MQICLTPMSVPVVSRDSFATDPFFLAARQTLEKCLLELTQKHQDLQLTVTHPTSLSAAVNGIPVATSNPCCCCCHQAVERLGNWAPAVLIPCLNCTSDQVAYAQTNQLQHWAYTVQDPGLRLLPGQLSFTVNSFELLLDVHGFSPPEIKVSVKDNLVEVSAQHQEPSGHHQTSKSLMKRYNLPRNINTDLVQCSLSKEGILLVTAPWREC